MSTISNNNYYYSASTVHSALEKAVSSLSENIACYSSDPVSDFTRNRKLNCSNLIHYILHLSNKTIQSGLMDYFSDIDDTHRYCKCHINDHSSQLTRFRDLIPSYDASRPGSSDNTIFS